MIKKRINAQRIKNSMRAIKDSNSKAYYPSAFFILCLFSWLLLYSAISKNENQTIKTILLWFSVIFALVVTVMGILMILSAIGTPKGTKSIETRLQNISFCDKSGKPPMLMRLHNNGKRITFTFYSPLIPKSDFLRKQEAIENALNVNIASIEVGKDLQEIIIEAVKGDLKLPDFIPWQDNYISPNDGEIVIGETMLDRYVLDFDNCVHCILAGATNSGKTALEKLIMYQFINKKADVYLIDYKKGVDFPEPWDKYCRLVSKDEDFYNVLNDICEIMDDRARILKEAKCKSLKEYNQKHNYPMKRILVVVDEMAAAMSTKGLDKDKKTLKAKTENKIDYLAEQARFSGISLLLCMQRPDATVLSGQIRSNIPLRLLGRADENLADVVFGDKKMAHKIPSKEQGMFVDTDGEVLRAYCFDDSMWG